MEIIPGILEKEWGEIERKINLVRSFAKSIHIDIIDGKFAPNITFLDPTPFAKYTHSAASGRAILFEAHLMVEDPINYLKPFADAGFRRFLGHIEKMSDQEEFVAQGQLLGEVGLAIDGPTPLDSVKAPYGDLDCILVMTIKAGESGQAFTPEYLEKVKIMNQAKPDQDDTKTGMKVEVDGGINNQTIIQAKNAGATRFVANSFIFKTDSSDALSAESKFNLLHNLVKV